VISTVEPETRHADKAVTRRHDGYKAHLAVEPDMGSSPTARDPGCRCRPLRAAVGADLLADEPDPVQVLGDSAYGTGELLDALDQAGHTAIIEPCEQAGTLRCPAG
jgi:hypothetical protein